MLIDDFNETIDTWITQLEHYNYSALCTKPNEQSWSLGQLYMHLILDTEYYVKEIKTCLSTKENVMEDASPSAIKMFVENSFPDVLIKGDPSNAKIFQPQEKNQLALGLRKIKTEINYLWKKKQDGLYNGKTKHPGLNYFSADQWLQFAEMHFRHHLRQKERIDKYLTINNLL